MKEFLALQICMLGLSNVAARKSLMNSVGNASRCLTATKIFSIRVMESTPRSAFWRKDDFVGNLAGEKKIAPRADETFKSIALPYKRSAAMYLILSVDDYALNIAEPVRDP